MESNFVDYVKIMCRSGKGGKGSMHLKHVKYNPNGGPDGGDGGKGGSIYLRGNHNYWTLLHLKYERHIFAEHGGNGGKDKCHGTDGKDVYIDVPCGTVVYNAETGKYVCDVTYDGQEVLLLKGGRGGLGNFQFRTATNQAPRYAQPGEPMQEMTIILELKLLADVGLVGFPNAGKSTLLNALLNDDRAIVSPIPGTTRDTIEETLVIDGLPFRIIDTAGLRHSDDPVEQLGIERSRRAIRNAEIVLVVADINGKSDFTEWMLEECVNRKSLLVLNKADRLSQPHYGNLEQDSSCFYVSALLGNGIDELKQAIVNHAGIKCETSDMLLTNVRHLDALKHVQQALSHVSQGLNDNLPADLLAIDLRDALHHLGTITGEVTTDELLRNIFSRFCIGK